MDREQACKSGDYLQHWDYRFPSQELVAAVAAEPVGAGAAALDLGCGAGREAVFLAQCGFRTFGLDLSAEALAIARGRARDAGVAVEWLQGSLLEVPLPDRAVDFLNDRGCFHHIPGAARPRYGHRGEHRPALPPPALQPRAGPADHPGLRRRHPPREPGAPPPRLRAGPAIRAPT